METRLARKRKSEQSLNDSDSEISDVDVVEPGENGETAENEHNEDNEVPPKKKRRRFNWIIEKQFESRDDMELFFGEERFWKKDTTKHLESGTKTLYYCTQVARTAVQCPSKIYIWEKADKTLYLMRNGENHHHALEGQKQRKVPVDAAVLERVRELVVLKVRPRQISHSIREDNRFAVKPDEIQVSVACQFLKFKARVCQLN